MVKSKLDADNINYDEDKEVDADDFDHPSARYNYTINNLEVVIVLGMIRHTYSKYNVVYYPIYLVFGDEVDSKIGVFEVESSKALEAVDEDGDIDLTKGKIIIFASKDYLQSVIAENKTNSNITVQSETKDDIGKGTEENPIIIEDSDDVTRLDLPKDKVSAVSSEAGKELSEGVFLIKEATDTTTFQEETLEESDKLKGEFNESTKNNWMQNFIMNMNYKIVDNEAGGDCLFAVIRDGFLPIGKETTVAKLRALLSTEATEEVYSNSRLLYVEYLAEIQDKEKEMKEIKKKTALLKKRSETSSNKEDNKAILKEAKDFKEKYQKLVESKELTQELMNEFEHMKDIDSLDKFKEFMLTRNYWADSWAISTLERLLNIKIIILSEEAFENGDKNSVLLCGQLNDEEAENKGSFKPDYYIITTYSGNHYKLITYKEKTIFKFRELPYDVRVLVINKCMERNAGPYYLIEDFRNLKTRLGLDADEGRPHVDEDEFLKKDIYDKNIVFRFYSHSDPGPKAGTGSGETILPMEKLNFTVLNNKKNKAMFDWRKKLDDSWSAPFTVDSHRWNTVEHYYLGSQYKKGFPDFYLQFSLDSESKTSTDLALAHIAGSESGKLKDKILRKPEIKPDADFFEQGENSRSKVERKTALLAKFGQNLDLKQVLLATRNAKLTHFKRGREPETDDLLMEVRKELAVA
jgi:hypothetical protein